MIKMGIHDYMKTFLSESYCIKFMYVPGKRLFSKKSGESTKVIHPKYYKHLKKTAQHSPLGWFLAE